MAYSRVSRRNFRVRNGSGSAEKWTSVSPCLPLVQRGEPPHLPLPTVRKGLADTVRHVIGCRLTQETGVHNALDDLDCNIR